jgi:hypothetical protein
MDPAGNLYGTTLAAASLERRQFHADRLQHWRGERRHRYGDSHCRTDCHLQPAGYASNGFTGTVTLTCSGAPNLATCTPRGQWHAYILHRECHYNATFDRRFSRSETNEPTPDRPHCYADGARGDEFVDAAPTARSWSNAGGDCFGIFVRMRGEVPSYHTAPIGGAPKGAYMGYSNGCARRANRTISLTLE